MNRISAVFIFILPILFSSPLFSQTKKHSIKKVVIDPGHGGHDAGCLGTKGREKEVALSISLKLGKLIEENNKDVKVIFTRKTDIFVELHERAEIANSHKADLFICVHANAGAKTAFGTETFVMGLHKSEDNLKVAKRENASILMEDNYKAKYEGFDPNSAEAYIAFTLYQNAFLDQSLNFAAKVENYFQKLTNRPSRGVKQAGFLVLYRTTMPSVLIETGFLTNVKEEQYLLSEEGQNAIATSIYKAFRDYKEEFETGHGKIDSRQSPKDDKPVLNKSLKEEKTESKKEQIPENVDPVEKKETDATEEGIFFSIQIASSSKSKPIPQNSSQFKGVKDVQRENSQDGTYRYTVGRTKDFEDASRIQTELKEKGFKDAFIVAYNNGKRITINEAQTLLKK